MANPSMVIRVAATIAELKANLAEGKSQIETTTASMQKMAASLSGEKLIQSAHNITAAVNQIGGASKLTDAEAARVNATLTRALEKYAALGKEAPGAMVALANATKQVEAPTEGLSVKMIALGTAIGAMAANALIALGKLALDGIKALASGVADLVRDGARLSGLEQSFTALAASLGETSAVMLGAMRTGTRGLVADLDLMQAANKAVLLGLPVTSKELGDLAQTATVLGRAMGLTATTAFNDLITALGRSSPMILDNLGLTVKVGEANEAYAATLQKTAKDLTDAERKQAFFNAAMEAARAKIAALGEAQLTLGERIQTAGVWWTNFRNDLSIAVARSTVLGAGLEALGQSIAAAFGGQSQSLVAAITAGVNKFALFVVDAGMFLVEFGRTGHQVFSALEVPVAALRLAIVYLVERFAAAIATMTELAAAIPGVGRAFTGLSTHMQQAAQAWGDLRDVTSAHLATTLENAQGQGRFGQALDTAAAALSNMKARMVEAELTTRQVVDSTQTQTAAVLEVTQANTQYIEHQQVATKATLDAAAAQEVYRTEARFTAEVIAEQTDALKAQADAIMQAATLNQRESASTSTAIQALTQTSLANIQREEDPFNLDEGGESGIWRKLRELEAREGTQKPSNNKEFFALQREAVLLAQLRLWAEGKERPPGFALGVENFTGGMAMVGERGPELVRLPSGSDVIPNHQLGGNLTIAPVLNFYGPTFGSSLEFEQTVAGAILNLVKSGAIPMPASV